MATEIIPPSEIQSELSRIWDALEGSNKNRASLFNLIFYTKKKDRAEYIRKISEKVLEKFPSRVIFITEDEEGDFLNTRVSVLSTGSGDSDIACDFIQLDVAGSFTERIPYVILPQILPDLPIYVIWSEDPAKESPLLHQLKKLADRLIFDSEATPDLAVFAKTLLQLDQDPLLDIADLNWARMESWRELLASTFYTSERLETLRKTSKIQILYNDKTTPFMCHPQIQAIYLQGWLAAQLDWQLLDIAEKEGTYTFNYSRKEGQVQVSLYPEQNQNVKPGDILSLDLETESNAHFSFGRNLNLPSQVSMRFSTLESCDLPLTYLFAKDESGASLVKEICHKGTSKHFTALLERIHERKEFSICEH